MRISRKIVCVALAGLTLALLLPACSATDSSANGPQSAEVAAEEAIEGGTITVALNADPGSLFDIHETGASVSSQVLRGTFDSLVSLGSDGEIYPWLAESWEISDDGLTYTFYLRQGVTFHDGEPFNAQAVKDNFLHVVAPETESKLSASALGGAAFKETEVVDEYTVALHLSEPFAPLLQNLGSVSLAFYSPKSIAESADSFAVGGAGITVGSGPFVFESYVAGQEISFTKNPDYNWGPANAVHTGPAYPDKLVYRILPEASVRAGTLTSGEVEAALELTPEVAASLEGDASIQITATAAPGMPSTIFLNHAQGVFTDKNIRLAFQYGIDISSAVDAVFLGQYNRAWSALSLTTPLVNDDGFEGSWAYDEDLANSLLDQAGWTERDADGFRTKNEVRLSANWLVAPQASPESTELKTAFKADLEKIGFELVMNPKEAGAYVEDLSAGNYDITDWSFQDTDGDILRLHLHSDGLIQNASFVKDTDLDKLLEESAQTTDTARRSQLFTEIQQWVIDDAAFVPVYTPKHINANRTSLHDVAVDLLGSFIFYDAWSSK